MLVLAQFDGRDFLLVLVQFDGHDVFHCFLYSLMVVMFFTGSFTVCKAGSPEEAKQLHTGKEINGSTVHSFFKFSNLLDTISTHTTFEQTSFWRIHNIVCRKCTWMYEIVSIETETHPACAPLTSCRNATSESAIDANIPTENGSTITRLGHVQPHGCLPADTMQLHTTLTGISLLHRKTYHAFASTSKTHC